MIEDEYQPRRVLISVLLTPAASTWTKLGRLPLNVVLVLDKSGSMNWTVPGSADTTLVTILGRQAGVSDGELTWEQVTADQTSLQPDLGGLKA